MLRFFLLGLALLTSERALSAATFNIANGDVAALANAINTSNGNLQDDTINLASNGTYILTAADSSTTGSQYGPSGLPQLADDHTANFGHYYNLTVNGNNATISRSSAAGTAAFRILAVTSQTTTQGVVTLNNITFANGSSVDGGGLYLFGLTVLNNCIIRDNSSTSTGGGLSTTSSVQLNNCTIMNNTARAYGGGIDNAAFHQSSGFSYAAALTLTDCTLFNNTTELNGSIGIYNRQSFFDVTATIDFVGCTVVATNLRNDATTNNGTGAIVTLKSTLLASSAFSNFQGSIISNGYNLSTATLPFNAQATDRLNADPKLDLAGPQMNGGPTPTIALCAGSDAIDHGSSGQFDLFDQRGFPRRVDNPLVVNTDDGTDIGAYEASADPLQYGIPSFVITSNTDHDDGVCSQNDCTLREAVARNNALDDAPFDLTFAPGVSGTITLAGELVLVHGMNLTGPGARSLAISGNNQSRVFSFLGSIFTTISGLTIRDGYVSGGAGSSNVGGGIYNEGTLTLNDCALLHNRVLGGAAPTGSGTDGGMARGGAIFNGTSLTLNRCTIGAADAASANSATGGNGSTHANDGVIYIGGKGGAGLGGAIYNDVNGIVRVTNSTINGNSAIGGTGAAGTNTGAGGTGGLAVGGILNAKTMTITCSTVASNSGTGGAGGHGSFQNGASGKGIGGIRAEAGTITVKSSLLALNTRNQSGGPDVDGAFVSGGYNLVGIGDFSTGFNQIGDQVGTTAAALNPQLGALQNNGGPTDTRALLSSSPAIDHGQSFGLTIDQRGATRPVDQAGYANASGGDGTDIGAFELEAANLPAVLSAVSRKTHGSAGAFDINLPLTGTPGIECRSGATHQMIVTFAQSVTVGAVEVAGGGSAAYSVNGAAVTITVTPNDSFPKRLTITLQNVNSAGDISIPMNILLGDTNGSGGVSASDVSQTKGASGQTANASNFRADVNVSGSVSASDISLVKSASGSQLPAGASARDAKPVR